MNEQWIDELRSHPVETDPRPGFKDELRAKLIAERNGATTPNTTHVDTYRRWRLFGAAAACVAVLVGGLVLLTGNDQALTPTTVPGMTLDTTAASGPVQPSAFEALDEARTRWADAAVASYQMTVAEDRNYWSRGCAWMTVVSGGVVTESTIDPSSTAQECPQAEWTVEQLHDLVSTWLGSLEEFASAEFGEHTFQVVYNEIGVPVTMEYDLANSDDEEASMRVTFEALQPNATTAPPRTNPGGVDGPVVFGQEPVDVGTEVEGAALAGTLELVGECLVAESPDGSTNHRTLIIWEFGTTWDQTTTSVIQQGGERIAIGEELDLGGGFHPLGSMNRYVSDLNVQGRIRSCSEALGTTDLFINQ